MLANEAAIRRGQQRTYWCRPGGESRVAPEVAVETVRAEVETDRPKVETAWAEVETPRCPQLFGSVGETGRTADMEVSSPVTGGTSDSTASSRLDHRATAAGSPRIGAGDREGGSTIAATDRRSPGGDTPSCPQFAAERVGRTTDIPVSYGAGGTSMPPKPTMETDEEPDHGKGRREASRRTLSPHHVRRSRANGWRVPAVAVSFEPGSIHFN
ncbi:hypothetical protein [Halobaculum lipolyticum]|uniref:Uncharacterized protein n=1 Tax=Halobaculum lipolyticum TaxID=3032001 RepID=A0ABD5W8U3_9EURY|nr:hypothetical protein [Halobaculum sp. DT31]